MYLTLPVTSLDDLLPKKYHKSGQPKQMPADTLSQIAIFTVKITKRFACANNQRAQQTGALPTAVTRRWSNSGSGSHGQLFRPYWGLCIKDPLMSPPPPPRFERLRHLCCLDTLRKIPFLWRPIEVTRFP